ncbi:PQQ-dependent sugar dehydrogenase [Lolliginicoccus suaedae]|uniref:PQQ-dependent sugar dehydrogenase n=1 Tax=Lolliginicoccus suaedae TaxID=2605429 RepID=UPI0011EFC8E6|nr:PQQ-dependent sugar dehydrogenase [Lolliginicoccus suaedae]
MRWATVVGSTVIATSLATVGVACSSPFDALGSGSMSPSMGDEDLAGTPPLTVSTEIDGLSVPWDVVTAPDGTLLTGERSGRFVAKLPGGTVREVAADLSDLWAQGETGLMGLALDDDFASNRILYACHGFDDGNTRDIRVTSWTVEEDWSALVPAGTVIDGFPTVTGQHGGCRILVDDEGSLYIATGDAAVGTNPQDPDVLGGKVLHVTTSGHPAAGNPDPASPVFTLGHRNPQGLAKDPASGDIYSVEHGPDRDDEVNQLVAGGNYGWRPDRAGFYDESVPMTDPVRVPGAIEAVWSSGTPPIAPGGMAFLQGAKWGEWEGAIVISALRGQQLRFLKLSAHGSTVVSEGKPPELDGTVGRIRSVHSQPDGSLLLTTSNRTGDRVLRVRPD